MPFPSPSPSSVAPRARQRGAIAARADQTGSSSQTRAPLASSRRSSPVLGPVGARMALDTAAAAVDADASRSRPDTSATVHSLLFESTSTAAAGETAGELDAKYASYARQDTYGTMGHGPLPAAQAARLALAAALLFSLRFVTGMLVLLLYYLVCRVCMLFVEADEGLPRLAGWRRKAVLRSRCALSRAMLFVFGFYWIRETHRWLPNTEVIIYPNDLPMLNHKQKGVIK